MPGKHSARICVLFAAMYVTPLWAQETSKLVQTKAAVIENQSSSATVYPVECDSQGNLYFRTYRPVERLFSLPVEKVTPEGKNSSTFDLGSVSDLERAEVLDFAVAPDGRVFELAQNKRNEWYVVGFDGYGKLETKFRLDTPNHSQLSKLAVFTRDRFLVSGIVAGEKGTPAGGEAFVGVFGRDGTLQAKVTLPGDVNVGGSSAPPAEEEKKGVEAESIAPKKEEAAAAISSGIAVSGDDGNVYLMRRTDPIKIYVLSASGQVLRQFTVPPPVKGAHAFSVRMAGPNIVIPFFGQERRADAPVYLALVNGQSGEKLSVFEGTMSLGALGCYDPASHKFTFLGIKDKQRAIIQAIAQ